MPARRGSIRRAGLSVQVGVSLKDMLLQHMLRFKFSVFGALQWKRDMAEYQAAAARFKVQRVSDGFEQVPPSPSPLTTTPHSHLVYVYMCLCVHVCMYDHVAVSARTLTSGTA